MKLIKKAISEVKGQYLEIIDNIGVSQDFMTKGKDMFLREIKMVNERYGKDKVFMQRQFESIRVCVGNKEK